MQKLLRQIFISLTIFAFPFVAGAQIIITEIMYNPEGTDSGREWIEIYNSGTENVDLSQYKLLENEVNHKISVYNSDDIILGAQKRAIIADNPEKFLADYNQGGNLLVDSAFSINNTGEEISIVDLDGQIVDTVLYSVDWGADGTGSSLQLNDFDWIPAEPTPWEENRTEADDENSDDDTSDDTTDTDSGSDSTHSGVNELSDYEPEVDLEISAGRNRHVLINSPVEFILQHNQDSTKNIDVKWSTGDGKILKGQKVKYMYHASGTYNIVLNTKNGDDFATSRTKVFVLDPEIVLDFQIRGKTVDIMLENKANNEVNLGGFHLKFEGKSFKIADDTIVDAKQTLVLSHEITGFVDDDSEKVRKTEQKPEITLYFPSGEMLDSVDLFPNISINIYQKIRKKLDLEKIHNIDIALEKVL